jgi:hypothetical protein
MKGLELLDYARRYFERKGIVRSIIPEQIIEDHIKLFYDRCILANI